MKGLIIINFKNYKEIEGQRVIDLVKIISNISSRYDINIIVSPPQPSLFHVAKSTNLQVICQHIDNNNLGPTTGYFIPELAKSYGAIGSLINHSEHKIDHRDIEELILKLRKLEMKSFVCASNLIEVNKIAKLEPDYIAIEPPELIGSGKAVSRENPKIITDTVNEVRKHTQRSKIICGAGIITKEDIVYALKLNAQGVLIASGIIKAKSWEEKLAELAQAF
ncbi:MAG: triose-phosphate isomerase [Nitrososphaeraceae archaeon]